jgi:ketosteroid isomerase-like protein
MKPSSYKILLLSICVFLSSGIQASQTEVEQKVTAFVTAFNEKDVDGMLNLASENIRWMSIAGESMAAEANGSEQLKTAMIDYFASYPDSYSKIRQIQSNGSWVTTLNTRAKQSTGNSRASVPMRCIKLKKG